MKTKLKIKKAANGLKVNPDFSSLVDKTSKQQANSAIGNTIATQAANMYMPGAGDALSAVGTITGKYTKDADGNYKSTGARILDELNPVTYASNSVGDLLSGNFDSMLNRQTFGLAGKSSADQNKALKEELINQAAIKQQNNSFGGLNSTFDQAKVFKKGGLIKRADGTYSKHGLWDSIRENKGSGKKPSKEMLEQEKKIKSKYADGGMVSKYPDGVNLKNPKSMLAVDEKSYDESSAPKRGNYLLPDLNRPSYKNKEGQRVSENKITVGFDDATYVLPTVIDGKQLTEDEAVESFRKTGLHMGKFAPNQKGENDAVRESEKRTQKYNFLDSNMGLSNFKKGGEYGRNINDNVLIEIEGKGTPEIHTDKNFNIKNLGQTPHSKGGDKVLAKSGDVVFPTQNSKAKFTKIYNAIKERDLATLEEEKEKLPEDKSKAINGTKLSKPPKRISPIIPLSSYLSETRGVEDYTRGIGVKDSLTAPTFNTTTKPNLNYQLELDNYSNPEESNSSSSNNLISKSSRLKSPLGGVSILSELNTIRQASNPLYNQPEKYVEVKPYNYTDLSNPNRNAALQVQNAERNVARNTSGGNQTNYRANSSKALSDYYQRISEINNLESGRATEINNKNVELQNQANAANVNRFDNYQNNIEQRVGNKTNLIGEAIKGVDEKMAIGKIRTANTDIANKKLDNERYTAQQQLELLRKLNGMYGMKTPDTEQSILDQMSKMNIPKESKGSKGIKLRFKK
jgi:hypothetical protein